MKIACALDHAGEPLRELVLQAVSTEGHEPVDLGTEDDDPTPPAPRATRSGPGRPTGRSGPADRARGSRLPTASCRGLALRARTTGTPRTRASSTTT